METFDLILCCIKNHRSCDFLIAFGLPTVTLGNVYISIKIHEEETGCTPT